MALARGDLRLSDFSGAAGNGGRRQQQLFTEARTLPPSKVRRGLAARAG